MTFPSLLELREQVLQGRPDLSFELATAIASVTQSGYEEADEGRWDLPPDHEPRHAISIAAEYLKFLAYGD